MFNNPVDVAGVGNEQQDAVVRERQHRLLHHGIVTVTLRVSLAPACLAGSEEYPTAALDAAPEQPSA